MKNNLFFHFFTLTLFKEKRRYIAIVAISALLIFLLSSVLFISSSIKESLRVQLDAQPDFIVQNMLGAKAVPIKKSYADKIVNIFGVEQVTKRVYGRYFFDDRHSALIIGIDFFDEQSNKALAKILNKSDIKSFLAKDNMLVGQGVYNYLKSHYYPKEYNFFTPSGALKRVNIFDVLPPKSSIASSDLIIMPQPLAKEILGIKKSYCSDIAFNVPNGDEWSNIKYKLKELSYTIDVVSKKDMQEAYENLFNYKGGLFLVLYLIVFVTFALILYQRYSLANSVEKREIAILRALGWSIKDVLLLKVFENFAIVLFSFILGVSAGYLFVFVLHAPLLDAIFLGGSNLDASVDFIPVIDFRVLATIFILFATAFLGSILIPVWKIAVTEPKEALN